VASAGAGGWVELLVVVEHFIKERWNQKAGEEKHHLCEGSSGEVVNGFLSLIPVSDILQ
jgi:hypothetical protein